MKVYKATAVTTRDQYSYENTLSAPLNRALGILYSCGWTVEAINVHHDRSGVDDYYMIISWYEENEENDTEDGDK